MFFLLSPICGTFTCCHQGSTWLILSIQQVTHGPFWAWIVRYKTLCSQMCVTLFSTSKWKQWSVLFDLCVWNCFLSFVNKKYGIKYRIMASRLKRKLTNLREQDTLLEAFYNELDEREESFLGNRFLDEDDMDDDYELESGSDNNEADVIWPR